MATTTTMTARKFALVSDANSILLLAFVGGFVDTAGFLKLQGIFTSSITGNLVAAAASVSSMHGVLCRSIVCIVFTLVSTFGGALSFSLHHLYSWKTPAVCLCLFSLEVALIVAFWVVGTIYNSDIDDSTSVDDSIVILIACIMAASMGIQNIAVRETFPAFPPTTVMTSTLVNFGANSSTTLGFLITTTLLKRYPISSKADEDERTNFTNKLSEYEKKTNEIVEKVKSNLKPLVSFIVGSVIGAVTVKKLDFHCMFIPVVVLVFLVLDMAWKYSQDKPKPQLPAMRKEVETEMEAMSTSASTSSLSAMLPSEKTSSA